MIFFRLWILLETIPIWKFRISYILCSKIQLQVCRTTSYLSWNVLLKERSDFFLFLATKFRILYPSTLTLRQLLILKRLNAILLSIVLFSPQDLRDAFVSEMHPALASLKPAAYCARMSICAHVKRVYKEGFRCYVIRVESPTSALSQLKTPLHIGCAQKDACDILALE